MVRSFEPYETDCSLSLPADRPRTIPKRTTSRHECYRPRVRFSRNSRSRLTRNLFSPVARPPLGARHRSRRCRLEPISCSTGAGAGDCAAEGAGHGQAGRRHWTGRGLVPVEPGARSRYVPVACFVPWVSLNSELPQPSCHPPTCELPHDIYLPSPPLLEYPSASSLPASTFSTPPASPSPPSPPASSSFSTCAKPSPLLSQTSPRPASTAKLAKGSACSRWQMRRDLVLDWRRR